MTARRRFSPARSAPPRRHRAAARPGADVAVVKTEVNNTGSSARGRHCSATCSLSVRAGVEFFTKTSSWRRRSTAVRRGALRRALPRVLDAPEGRRPPRARWCGAGRRVRVPRAPRAQPEPHADLPLTVTPTASMYSAARPPARRSFRVRRRRARGASSRSAGAAVPRAVADDAAFPACFGCRAPFTLFNRRHHCRHCGFVFCKKCAARGRPGAGWGRTAAAAAAARGGGRGRRRLRARRRALRHRRRGGRRRAERGRVRPRSRDHDRERRVRNRRRPVSPPRARPSRADKGNSPVSKPEPTILPTREM